MEEKRTPHAQWRHFTSTTGHRDSITIDRAEGCYFWSTAGKKYLDAIAGLHSVNIGYGPWPEITSAAATQLDRLPFFPNWFGFTNEVAERLAGRLQSLSPVDSGRVFFVQSGAEAVEAAMKLARQFHTIRGDASRVKFISRAGAYHGTTLGALALNGSEMFRAPFEPLQPEAVRVATPYPYRCGWCSETRKCTLACADDIESAIVAAGPETVAAVVVEPAQHSGGSLIPPADYPRRLREICDLHGVLLIVDETICGFGRVGEWFGSIRYGFQPDIITMAKGLTSSYAPLGAMVASGRTAEPFFAEDSGTFLHGSTFGGHPVSAAIALANLDVIEQHGLIGKVRADGPKLSARCADLAARHPMVGEVRGDGFFVSLELVKDADRRTPFSAAERSYLIGRVLLPGVRAAGVQMKFDDRLQLAAQFTPPLVAGDEEFEVMVAALEQVLDRAWREVRAGSLPG